MPILALDVEGTAIPSYDYNNKRLDGTTPGVFDKRLADLLRQFYLAGWKIVVVSLNTFEYLGYYQREFKLNNIDQYITAYFPADYDTYDLTADKLRKYSEQFAIPAQDIYYFDDTERFINSAKKNGFEHAYHVSEAGPLVTQLEYLLTHFQQNPAAFNSLNVPRVDVPSLSEAPPAALPILHVSTSAGQAYEFMIDDLETVATIKQQIFKTYGHLVDEQRLVMNNKGLADNTEIKPGQSLRLVLKPDFDYGPIALLARRPYQEIKETRPLVALELDKLLVYKCGEGNVEAYWNSLNTFAARIKLFHSIPNIRALVRQEEGIQNPPESSQNETPVSSFRKPKQEVVVEPSMNFIEFKRLFSALFDDTNSKGIKRVLKKLDGVSNGTDEAIKFIEVGKEIEQVVKERRSRKWSKTSFFGAGRSPIAQAFYDCVFFHNRYSFDSKSPDSVKSLLNNIIIRSNQPGSIWSQPGINFNEFYEKFRDKFKATNSSGIKRIIKQMQQLKELEIKDDIHERYKFTKICKIMHEISRERLEKKSINRKDDAKDFYETAGNCNWTKRSTMAEFVADVIKPFENKHMKHNGPSH